MKNNFLKGDKGMQWIKEKLKINKKSMPSYTFLFFVLLLIGILVRTIGISKFPNALNCDEASSGYEAFSILNYGIDRNGKYFPVFLVSWGGGQNALLTYLIIPFIKIFGLNLLSIRLPLALTGCISLFIVYFLFKKIGNRKLALLALFLFTICPWHILKSRWGLESNLFPDLILWFSYLFIKGVEENNKLSYYLSFVIAGISAYAYGTSYYFLPIFLIPLLGITLHKKKITLKQAILSLCIVGFVSLPIILYVVINTLDLKEIVLPFLTIPKLEVNRYQEITSIFKGKFFTNSLTNFIESLRILITQNDYLPWNAYMPYGTIYLFSSLFTFIGLINSFRKKKKLTIKYEYLFQIWFIVGIILTFICEPNINRLNILMIPILYFTIKGLYLVSLKLKKYFVFIIALYIFSFGCFLYSYTKEDFNTYGTFEGNLEEVILFASQWEEKEIHITDKIQSSYMHVLFYTKYDTKKFVDTVVYEDEKAPFKHVLSFGNFYFEEIENTKLKKDTIYIIKKEEQNEFDLTKYKVYPFDNYFVIET